jgi:hypothetical protein
MKWLAVCVALLLAPAPGFCDWPVRGSAQDQGTGESNGKVEDNLQSVLNADPQQCRRGSPCGRSEHHPDWDRGQLCPAPARIATGAALRPFAQDRRQNQRAESAKQIRDFRVSVQFLKKSIACAASPASLRVMYNLGASHKKARHSW